MIKTPTQILLDSPIPASEIETRSQAGITLSYLTGQYVINRLNQVLGQGNWAYKVDAPKLVWEGKQTQRSGEVFAVSYTAQCSILALIDQKQVEFTDIGYGDGTDKTNPGKAHELAVKEAATDAIKRAAKNFGISMGLGLYFKGGEYVAPEATVIPIKAKPTTVPAPEVAKPAARKAPTKDLLKAAFAVLNSQGKVTPGDFTSKFLNNKKVVDLTDTEAETAIKTIRSVFPDLAI